QAEARLRQLRELTLPAAEQSLRQAQANLTNMRQIFQRTSTLHREGHTTRAQLDDAQKNLDVAETQVRSAELQVQTNRPGGSDHVLAATQLEQARAAAARARDLRGLATLTAPQDGVVTAVMAEPGAAVAAGQPVVRLAATGEREIVIDLTEQDVAAYPAGTRFAAHLVVNPEVSAPALLNRIDPVAYSATRTRAAHLTLQSPPAAFRLGALVRVTPAARGDAGVALPLAAVLDAAAAAAVWVVDRSDGRVHRRRVRLGPEVGGFVVIAAGLAAGDEVVTKGIHSLDDGQAVGPRVTE
ncbi:efflux RND transporter periplasmic adaptor subunit, partial [Albidovulum sp.]|uniref:efflux RND transporter periplasmic adaptor subunit n=1 Tax=Albidovulum sp. TaxID=1872424 RepID=UPI0039B91455